MIFVIAREGFVEGVYCRRDKLGHGMRGFGLPYVRGGRGRDPPSLVTKIEPI